MILLSCPHQWSSVTALNENAPSPTGWKAGAKALAEFQKVHQGVAKGSKVDGGPRQGQKYANLLDVLRIASQAADHGLSHTGQARLVGENLLVWREYLHHESGESVYTEHPIIFKSSGNPTMVQQEIGAGVTYARKYCCQALFGLYADDGLDVGDLGDPDSQSFTDAERKAAAAKKDDHRPAAGRAIKDAAPAPVAVAKPKQEKLTPEQHQQCVDILQHEKNGPKNKAAFLAKFCPDADAIYPEDIEFKEHLDFLMSLTGAAI